MQRDPKKLTEASLRRLGAQCLLVLMVFPAMDYALFLVSDGYRDLFGLGHWNLLVLTALLAAVIAVARPIYRLEWPWQYQREQRQKATTNRGGNHYV